MESARFGDELLPAEGATSEEGGSGKLHLLWNEVELALQVKGPHGPPPMQHADEVRDGSQERERSEFSTVGH